MFGIAGTVEVGTICPGTGTWNRLDLEPGPGTGFRTAYLAPSRPYGMKAAATCLSV